MKLFPRSARARLALTYALTVTLLILIYSASLFYLYREDLLRDLNKKLRNDIETMEMIVEQAQGANDVPGEIAKVPSQNLDSSNWLTEVWTPQGVRVFSSGRPDELPLGKLNSECFKADAKGTDLVLPSSLSVRALCLPSEALPDQYVIRVARLTETVRLQLSRFLSLMIIGISSIVFLVAIAAYALARRTLAPIKKISEKAKAISAEKLGERLPVQNPDDELGELAQTFNQTFERLENSFSQMRRFTSDASHELRTPLAAIRAIGEVALRRNGASHETAISGILEEATRLQNLCESLLLLSKADAGSIPFKFENIKLSKLVFDSIQILEILAEEKDQTIRIEIPPDLMLKADPNFLRQAIMNLVDNAIKFSPKQSLIFVQGLKAKDEITLSIKDNGPGIAPEHQSRIFDRFYRVDTGRTRTDGGAGLGLAICQWIISAHKGHIQLRSEDGKGAEFILHFPT